MPEVEREPKPATPSLATPRVLVVDDEPLVQWSLRERMLDAGYRADAVGTCTDARRRLEEPVDLVLLDYKLPDGDGLSLLEEIKAQQPDAVVIFMTAHSTIEQAVSAMKLGAFHYLNKPFEDQEMLLLIERALETTQLRRELRAFRSQASEPYSLDKIIGRSGVIRDVKRLIEKVASSPSSTVLLTGESGGGKGLAARVIHFNSDRAHKRFVNITCTALPESLLESELFGHERGAFTDAKQMKAGLFEVANGGTVFLDEIGDISPALQAKLLGVLEDRSLKRVGGTSSVAVDVRVIAATNRHLEEEVAQRRFREDLYYRLNVLPIHIPPLRERSEDIAPLAQHYVQAFNEEFHKNVQGLAPDALKLLREYGWPGNIRELRNALERAMLLTETPMLHKQDFLGLPTTRASAGLFRLPPDGVDIESVERDLVTQALGRTNWNQTQAARLLGLNRDKVRYRIEKYKLEPERD